LLKECIEACAPLRERFGQQRASALVGKKVKRDKRRGIVFGKLCNSGRRRMQPQLKCLERLFADDDLSVEHKPADRQRSQYVLEFGKIPVQRLLVTRLQVHCIAIAERYTAKAVPLWLELPSRAGRQAVDRHGFHRLERKGDIEAHAVLLPSAKEFVPTSESGESEELIPYFDDRTRVAALGEPALDQFSALSAVMPAGARIVIALRRRDDAARAAGAALEH
jgi:hypothetical protein